MKTQLILERAMTDLHYDWLALFVKTSGQNPTVDQTLAMLQRLRDFVALVRAQVEQETDAWVLEFQSSLADLANTVRAKSEASMPGSLQVSVANAKEFDGCIKATLDHLEERILDGTQCLFSSVPPVLTKSW